MGFNDYWEFRDGYMLEWFELTNVEVKPKEIIADVHRMEVTLGIVRVDSDFTKYIKSGRKDTKNI